MYFDRENCNRVMVFWAECLSEWMTTSWWRRIRPFDDEDGDDELLLPEWIATWWKWKPKVLPGLIWKWVVVLPYLIFHFFALFLTGALIKFGLWVVGAFVLAIIAVMFSLRLRAVGAVSDTEPVCNTGRP